MAVLEVKGLTKKYGQGEAEVIALDHVSFSVERGESVGMRNASLRKMIYCESIICMIKAFIPGITFGIAIPFVINLSIRKAFPMLYSIPYGILVVGITTLFVIVMLITCLEMNKLKDKSIIDEIRMDVI